MTAWPNEEAALLNEIELYPPPQAATAPSAVLRQLLHTKSDFSSGFQRLQSASQQYDCSAYDFSNGHAETRKRGYGTSLFACVMDSYDYDNALDVVSNPPIALRSYALAGSVFSTGRKQWYTALSAAGTGRCCRTWPKKSRRRYHSATSLRSRYTGGYCRGMW
eukprot:961551-Rhodomonas_salina.2